MSYSFGDFLMDLNDEDYLNESDDEEILNDEEILERMDIKVIEAFLRKKKLENIEKSVK